MTYSIAQVIKISKKKNKLNKIFACTPNPNIGARKSLEKNGFVEEGILNNHLFLNNKYYDEIYYGLLLR